MKNQNKGVCPEGVPFILFSAFTTLIFAMLGYDFVALLGLALTGFILYFFRDPSRVQPEVENGVICPADGKIILVKEILDDRFIHDKVIKISIFMNMFNVHVNRIPVSGTVERILFEPGKFYSADKDKAALHNEYCAMTIKTDENKTYGVVQVAGLIARRIVCRAEQGDKVQAGDRYGLIRFGSRVDLYLPADTKITITHGQKVKAGETLLGHMT